jgi:taurine--2-oxoglutarate transaminase
MEDEGIVANAKRIGAEELGPALAALGEKHPVVGEVRGTGVFWALELVADAETRAPLPGSEIAFAKAELIARGVLPFTVDNRIHVVPPCVVTADEVAQAITAYDDVLTLLDGRL